MKTQNWQTVVNRNDPLPAGLTQTGSLYLGGYAHPLPAGLKTRETRPEFENT
jgi:hypothetical protein